MGKRQVRIFQKDLEQRLPELLQQPVVQVVLRTKAVLAGSLSSINSSRLQLKDFRFNKHEFTPDEVEEIFYDIEAPY
ncbi:hypothetical protein ABID22_000725 [Pontibacter aydingkolensis]|uniref:Uncharacterized protein n=1 Tax=Pontibacter aydingkolensis TaxID=1911536 RepID=A0ABS7CRC0_9BACT|nr:hypothetical protein [Pontibacter aydingkolensis]MBW7466402.1 hypothetical protein [Pontibacter aydingkolensis]